MTDVVVAYIPVLHEGYRRFLEAHGSGRPLYVIGEDLYAHHAPLAKDIRALDPALVAPDGTARVPGVLAIVVGAFDDLGLRLRTEGSLYQSPTSGRLFRSRRTPTASTGARSTQYR